MKALVIEDNDDDYQFLKELGTGLECHWDFIRASTLSQASEKLKSDTYDVILLDLVLPDSNERTIDTFYKGLEIRNKSIKNAKTPIIIVTGSKDFKTGREAMSIGASDFVTKDNLRLSTLARCLNFVTYDPLLTKRDSTLWGKTKKTFNILFST